MSPYALTRRQTLSGLAATAMMPVAARAQARRYDLKPREVAGGVWMIEGLRGCLPGLPEDVRVERNTMARHLIVAIFADRERAVAAGKPTPHPD